LAAGVFGAVSGRGEVVLDATAVCAERLTFGALTTFLEAKSKGLLQVVGGDGVVKTMTRGGAHVANCRQK
jgi:hypothetical protein